MVLMTDVSSPRGFDILTVFLKGESAANLSLSNTDGEVNVYEMCIRDSISDLTNKELVQEVRSRLNGISIDYCIAIEEVAMLIEENSYMVTNRILATERPDRVAKALSEGRVAFILNGSPHRCV